MLEVRIKKYDQGSSRNCMQNLVQYIGNIFPGLVLEVPGMALSMYVVDRTRVSIETHGDNIIT